MRLLLLSVVHSMTTQAEIMYVKFIFLTKNFELYFTFNCLVYLIFISFQVYKIGSQLTFSASDVSTGACLRFRDGSNIVIDGQDFYYTHNLYFVVCEIYCEQFTIKNIVLNHPFIGAVSDEK